MIGLDLLQICTKEEKKKKKICKNYSVFIWNNSIPSLHSVSVLDHQNEREKTRFFASAQQTGPATKPTLYCDKYLNKNNNNYDHYYYYYDRNLDIKTQKLNW